MNNGCVRLRRGFKFRPYARNIKPFKSYVIVTQAPRCFGHFVVGSYRYFALIDRHPGLTSLDAAPHPGRNRLNSQFSSPFARCDFIGYGTNCLNGSVRSRGDQIIERQRGGAGGGDASNIWNGLSQRAVDRIIPVAHRGIHKPASQKGGAESASGTCTRL